MAIVTSSYQPKRAPKKRPRSYPADMQTIVTAPAPKKQLKGPVIRLREQTPEKANDNGEEQPRRSAIVEPKRKPSNAMLTHLLEDISDEERNRRADMAVEMFREIKRRAAKHRD
jgi:hypothetical protein